MNTSDSTHNAPAAALGFLALCGLAIEWKHGVPAICAPFVNCSGPADFFLTLHHLPDATFLGLLVWVGILLGSLLIIARLLAVYARRIAGAVLGISVATRPNNRRPPERTG